MLRMNFFCSKVGSSSMSEPQELPPFHFAARHGNMKELSQLLQLHPDLIDYGDNRGYTALMHAVFSQNLQCMCLLLGAGCKTELQDAEGRTALMSCARQGWPDGCEAMLNFNSNYQTIDQSGRNVVHVSACIKNSECLETVLKYIHEASIINKVDVEGMTPLHWASFHNLPDNIALLLEHGADASILDNEKKNPLHWAAQNGCTAACGALLYSSMRKDIVDQTTDQGKTPLHFAAAAGNLDVIFALSQGFGCDLDLGDNEGRTALHWACAMGEYHCVAGLLRLGVIHTSVDRYKVPPVAYAKQLNHSICVSLLKNYNPNKPHDILIPAGLHQLENRRDDKYVNCTASHIPEGEIFSLKVSNEREQKQIENIKRLYSQMPINFDETDKLQYAFSRMLQHGNDDCVEVSRCTDHAALNHGAVDFSEDEQRYQTQMAISPPLHSSKLSSNMVDGSNIFDDVKKRKSSKPPKSSRVQYKLAPIRNTAAMPNVLTKMSHQSSVATINPVAKGRKVSGAPSDSIPSESELLNHASFGLRNKKKSITKPPGLRRKSNSLNDGLALFEKKDSSDLPLMRTQSFGFSNQIGRKLPAIEAGDGQNRIHFSNRKLNEMDKSFNEGNQVSALGLRSDLHKRKKRLKGRHKINNQDVL